MNWFKGLNELGKGFINLAIAIIVFAIVQPLVSGKASLSISIASAVIAVILFFIGVILSSIGGADNER